MARALQLKRVLMDAVGTTRLASNRLPVANREKRHRTWLSRWAPARVVSILGVISGGVVDAFVALVAVPVVGCTDNAHPDTVRSDTTHSSLVVSVADEEGRSIQSFVAILASDDGPIATASCPKSPAPGTSCEPDGLHLQTSGRLGITIKARGYGFITKDIDSDDLDHGNGPSRAEIKLTRLAPFVVNDDYATGLDVEGGAATFEALAQASATELGLAQTVKFYITGLDGEPRVYLQNTRRHQLHYDFAHGVVGIAQTPAEFEAATYSGANRSAFAGTLTYNPDLTAKSVTADETLAAPMTVSFFPGDDITPAQALLCHRLLEERLGNLALSGDRARLAYLPAGEDSERALSEQSETFARAGAAWITQRDLYGGLSQQFLNDGVAYGTLRRLSPEELKQTVVSSSDVLVLSRLPNELPVVAGTITEELQTPLAHVNVAARARGTPNLALLGAGTDPRVQPLLGKLVRFEVQAGKFRLEEVALPEAVNFWSARRAKITVPSSNLERAGLPLFDELAFADWISVGVKAANLAELHHLLPEQAPNGFAVPFRYYDEHLHLGRVTATSCATARSACIADGRVQDACDRAQAFCASGPAEEDLWSLAQRLLATADVTADSVLRDAALACLRHHILSTPLVAELGAALDARVTELFGNTQVRLRSSTNAEDLPNFSGAGLYQSVSAGGSGRLASDRIREVWASVWGFQAFEERSYWGIDQLAVRMAVAVHPAYDDEVANGVLITQNIADPTRQGMYVNVQRGEVSVTNPSDGSLPETFSIVASPTGVQVARQRYSSLSPNTPLLDEDQIARLLRAAVQIQNHFAKLYERDTYSLALDLEFKFVGAERRLVVKQARPYVR